LTTARSTCACGHFNGRPIDVETDIPRMDDCLRPSRYTFQASGGVAGALAEHLLTGALANPGLNSINGRSFSAPVSSTSAEADDSSAPRPPN
jgi:hypothetical protein